MHGEYGVTVTQQFVALPFSVRLAVVPPLCRIYLHTAGKKEEKAELEIVRISRDSSGQLLRLGVRLLRFCEFFGE